MKMLKRTFFYGVIILLIFSIQKDLKQGAHLDDHLTIEPSTSMSFHVRKLKTKPGETVLSIVETLNPHSNQLDIEQIITDFKIANPNVNPYELNAHTYYYFPVYTNGG